MFIIALLLVEKAKKEVINLMQNINLSKKIETL